MRAKLKLFLVAILAAVLNLAVVQPASAVPTAKKAKKKAFTASNPAKIRFNGVETYGIKYCKIRQEIVDDDTMVVIVNRCRKGYKIHRAVRRNKFGERYRIREIRSKGGSWEYARTYRSDEIWTEITLEIVSV